MKTHEQFCLPPQTPPMKSREGVVTFSVTFTLYEYDRVKALSDVRYRETNGYALMVRDLMGMSLKRCIGD